MGSGLVELYLGLELNECINMMIKIPFGFYVHLSHSITDFQSGTLTVLHAHPLLPTGNGGTGREGTSEGNWHLQLYHHKDGTPSPDSQDCACSEPGGAPPLSPATEAQGLL